MKLLKLLLFKWIAFGILFSSCRNGDESKSMEPDNPRLIFQKTDIISGFWKDSLVGPLRLDQLPAQKLGTTVQKLTDSTKTRLEWHFLKKASTQSSPFQPGPGKQLSLPVNKFGNGKTTPVPQLPLSRSSLSALLHLKNKQGLPGTFVQALWEDLSGRLWIGTDNGLGIYDGSSLRSFSMEDGLPNQYITSLVEYEKGKMAIGTKSGLVITDGLHYQHISQKNGLLSNWITRLHVSGKKLFIGTDAGLQVLVNGLLMTPDLPGKKVSAISGWQKDMLCIGYSSGEAIQLNLLSGEMESMRPFPENGITGISHFREGEILLNIDRQGLFRWKNDSLFAGRSPAVNFSSMELQSFYPDKDKIWFCGFNSGMYGLGHDGNLEILKPQDGLISDQLSSLLKLRDGSFLLGSWGGLNILKDVESRQFFAHQNLNGKIPFGVAFSPDSILWISTMDGGVNRWKNGNSYSFSEQSGLRTGTVYNFAFGKNGLSYLATSGDALKIIDGKFTFTLGKAHGLSSLNVNTVLVSADSSVYIGSNESGLYRWKNDKLYHMQSKKEMPGQSIYSLFESPTGEIIVGSNGDGIFALKNGRFRKLVPPKGESIPAVYPIAWWNHQLCFGTFGGGLFFWKGDSLARIGEKEGLANQTVVSVEITEDNVLVCGTGKGISLLRQRKNGLHIRNLNAADAFQYEDFNPYSAAFDGKNLWMGAGDSFLKLSADAIRKIPRPLPLITGIEFGEREWLRLSTTGKLLFTEDTAGNLEIPYTSNTARIRLGHKGMAFPQDKIEYSWQLLPLETSWKKAGEVTTADYPRLDAGEYTFRFRVREAGMEWSKDQEFSFRILPPWWETWWFRLLEGSAGILLIFGIVQFRTRSLKREKVKLEGIVQERTAEVVEQKEIIEHKNRNIIQSMEYASRIQRNILPPVSELKTMIPESFILYQPKDIVSGDFYWFHPLPEDSLDQPGAFGESVLIAACDCTGHGIPGAMVSVVCRGALQKAVRELKLKKPAEILAEASKVVAQELGKITNTDADIPDGMDVSMVRLDLKNRQVQWAGAHNPLWILRKGEILETKGDNVSIGSRNESIDLNGHEISLETGDFLFMFSDGFADQFGGPKEKKLTKQGFKNMLISLENEPAGIFREKLLAAHLEWKGQCSQVDDICVIGIKI